MAIKRIEVRFNKSFKGELLAKNGKVKIGIEKGELAPYDMLLGSLATCLYSTFLDVIEKKRITFDESTVIVEGEKRKEIPATLEWVKVVIEISNVSNEKGVLKAAELAEKYCSIYETISKVAEMSLEVKFI